MTTVDPRVYVHDPDFLLDELEADSFPREPIPCYSCGRTDLLPWRHVTTLRDGERGVCEPCYDRDRCAICRRLTGDGGDRWPYVMVSFEGNIRPVCDVCAERGRESIDIPVSYEEDDGA